MVKLIVDRDDGGERGATLSIAIDRVVDIVGRFLALLGTRIVPTMRVNLFRVILCNANEELVRIVRTSKIIGKVVKIPNC